MQTVHLVAFAFHQAHMGDIQAVDIGHQGKDVAIAELGQRRGQSLERDKALAHEQVALKLANAVAVSSLLHGLVAVGVTAHEIEASLAARHTR